MTPQCVLQNFVRGGRRNRFQGGRANWLEGEQNKTGSRRGRHWFQGGRAKLVKAGQNWLKGE